MKPPPQLVVVVTGGGPACAGEPPRNEKKNCSIAPLKSRPCNSFKPNHLAKLMSCENNCSIARDSGGGPTDSRTGRAGRGRAADFPLLRCNTKGARFRRPPKC